MRDDIRQQVYIRLNQKNTAELVRIWQTNNRAEWAAATFDMVAQILQERHVELTPQHEPMYSADEWEPPVTRWPGAGETGVETEEILDNDHKYLEHVVVVGVFGSLVAVLALLHYWRVLTPFSVILLALLIGYWLLAFRYLAGDDSARQGRAGRIAVALSKVLGGVLWIVLVYLIEFPLDLWRTSSRQRDTSRSRRSRS